MNDNEWFKGGYKLPKSLSKQEVYDLLEKIKQGDERARSYRYNKNSFSFI